MNNFKRILVEFLHSDALIFICLIVGMVLLVGFTDHQADLHKKEACEHAAKFSTYEVRGDKFGCFVLLGDGLWHVIPDPANYSDLEALKLPLKK